MPHAFWLYCKWCEERKIDVQYGGYCSEYCRNIALKTKAEGKEKPK